jgi:membrane protease YdiL (CAAX protease family)
MLILLTPLFGGPGGEEPFGWRGYAQHKLQEKLGKWAPLLTSIGIGIAWGVWHLPEFYNPASTQYAIGFGFFIPMVLMWFSASVVMTWLYNKTGGSVLVAGVIFHLALDVSSSTLLADFSIVGTTEGIPPIDTRLLAAQILVFTFAALILVVVTKGRLGSTEKINSREYLFS